MTHTSPTAAPVLLLGATSDIAVSLAHEFARDGHPLYLAARNIEDLKVKKTDLEVRHKVDVRLVTLDVADAVGARKAIRDLSPPPHIAVCLVGYLGDQAEQQIRPAAAREVLETNFVGPSLLLEDIATQMALLDAETTIVGVSSVAGDRGRARNYYYGAAKAGFTAFLSGLRQRLNGSRTTIITVKPGFVATRMTADMDLPSALTDSAADCARMIKCAVDRKVLVVYPWKWYLIMLILRAVPETIFKRLKF